MLVKSYKNYSDIHNSKNLWRVEVEKSDMSHHNLSYKNMCTGCKEKASKHWKARSKEEREGSRESK
jgi:hypothetical protein